MHKRVGPGDTHQVRLADEIALTFDQRMKEIERSRADTDRALAMQQHSPARKKPVPAEAVRTFVHRAQLTLQTETMNLIAMLAQADPPGPDPPA